MKLIFFISQEQNDIKKNSVQLSWYPTLICCQLLIYIIKKKNEILTQTKVIEKENKNII